MGSFKCNVCEHKFYLPPSNAILNDEELVCPYCRSNNVGPCKFEELGMWNDNHFKKYTDHLADILQAKNDAYGDSFSKSLDEDGLLVLKIRLGDKFNRISSLIKKNELKENDESLEDTLLDLAGYSILGLKYLEEHKNGKDL